MHVFLVVWKTWDFCQFLWHWYYLHDTYTCQSLYSWYIIDIPLCLLSLAPRRSAAHMTTVHVGRSARRRPVNPRERNTQAVNRAKALSFHPALGSADRSSKSPFPLLTDWGGGGHRRLAARWHWCIAPSRQASSPDRLRDLCAHWPPCNCDTEVLSSLGVAWHQS